MIKVTLLYAQLGGGHLSLSQSTEEALHQFYPGQFKCEYFDPLPGWYSPIYRRLSTNLQSLWKLGYQTTDNPLVAPLLAKLNYENITRHMVDHFRRFRPDLIISNNAFINIPLQSALSQLEFPVKTIIYFADPFTLHQLWFAFKNADLYLSPTQEATRQAIENGLPPDKIHTVGWLTRQQFLAKPLSPSVSRRQLNLSPRKFTIFIGGAGQGGGKTYQLCKQITASRLLKTSQLIINTGSNSSLTTRLKYLFANHSDQVLVIPFTSDMSTLLAASDLAVGKAGPNFLFECIHMNKPFLATGCLPGQEEGNLDFITQSGIGWVEKDLSSAIYLLEQLANHPQLLRSKINSLKTVKKLHLSANLAIARQIHNLVN
jgi:1,2-diacylglycerol 3-beta-galactosyltransferase